MGGCLLRGGCWGVRVSGEGYFRPLQLSGDLEPFDCIEVEFDIRL